MFDIIQIYNLKYPNQPMIGFVKDAEWVEFESLRPSEGDNSYQEWLDFARDADDKGLLANWEGFIEMLPGNQLMGFLLTVKGDDIDLSIALLDLLVLISFPQLRQPDTIFSFFTKVVIRIREAQIQVPPSVILDWNKTVEAYSLPSTFLITG